MVRFYDDLILSLVVKSFLYQVKPNMRTFKFLLVLMVVMVIVEAKKFREAQLEKKGANQEVKNLKKKVRAVERENLRFICEMTTPGAICLQNGTKTISKRLKLQGCVSDFKFDQEINIDRSSSLQTAVGEADVSSGEAGIGAAAQFGQGQYFKVNHSPEYDFKLDTGYSIQIRLNFEKARSSINGLQCPILVKGKKSKNHKKKSSPSILYDSETGQIVVKLTALNTSSQKNEILTIRTLGSLKQRGWTNIVLAVTKESAKIYLNGILDGVKIFKNHKIIQNQEPFYIGGSPTQSEDCQLGLSISQVSIFNRELHYFEIQASLGLSNQGLVSSSQVHLACSKCSTSKATKMCLKGYSLCKIEDVLGGVWQLAAKMGWNHHSSKILTKESGEEKGLGICCADD